MRALKIFFLGMFLLGVVGCQTSDTPKDFPKTFPVTAIIKAGDTPLADATILLYAQNAQGSWASSGNTNANGEAMLVTNQGSYTAKGVPEGSYKVVLSKQQKAPSERSPEEVDAMSYDEQIAYSQKISAELAKLATFVPATLTDPKKTPLTLEVTKSGGELIVDISKYR